MGRTVLNCQQEAALSVYDHLVQSKELKPNEFDSGYFEINFREPSKKRGVIKRAHDGRISCTEIWEKSLIHLDQMGAKANWKEDVQEARDEEEKTNILHYQALRKLTETNLKRPIPWVFEAPYVGVSEDERNSLKLRAFVVRTDVKKAVGKLNEILAQAKAKDIAQYQKSLAVGLYWFTWLPSGEQKSGIPGIVADSLEKYGLKEFAKYLQQQGGLGLSKIERDAELEATALQTVLNKQGWCTEQSKVLYAVLRMGGLDALFIEPRLTADYLKGHKIPYKSPMPSHMSTGVGFKLKGEKREDIWVMDIALQMLRADYTLETPTQKPYPHWKLSLRHYWMADLSNIGSEQVNAGDLLNALESYDNALSLGTDSTAYHLFRNKGVLLKEAPTIITATSKSIECKTSEACTNMGLKMNPHDPALQYDKGIDLGNKRIHKKSLQHFLKAIDLDPSFKDAFEKIGILFERIQSSNRKEVRRELKPLARVLNIALSKIKKNHPKFAKEIQTGIEKICKIKGMEGEISSCKRIDKK